MSNFSGYVAIDELYEGKFCILSLVDNREYVRLIYEVLDHTPTHEDIERFLKRFQGILASRGLCMTGITTDGSALYPEPLSRVFPGVPHQICQFHILKDIVQAATHAVAKVRRKLKSRMPKLGRGRPCTRKQQEAARLKKRLQKKVRDLFENRCLFGKRHLSPCERRTFLRITQGLPELRILRRIVEEVYRLFDRRCRTATALKKLQRLRRRVRRFKKLGKTLQKLFSPNLDKALTFLDDSLLPSTSNAVERGNRRHRKMQRSVYRVRAKHTIEGRMALDLVRDQSASEYVPTLRALHAARTSSRGPSAAIQTTAALKIAPTSSKRRDLRQTG